MVHPSESSTLSRQGEAVDSFSEARDAIDGSDAVHNNGELSLDDPEKNRSSHDGTLVDRLDHETPIVFCYLTHETSLPNPSARSDGELTRLPKGPNLTKYTNPHRWGSARKGFFLAMCCIATFLTSYCAGSYSPPAQLIADDFHTSRLVVLIGITTFCLGFALIPMAMAPLSETCGRYPIFVVSSVVYLVFQVMCAVTPNLAGLLVARFFVGAGASVFSSVVGGVIADMWEKEQRNTPMALFSGCVLAGTGAGPLVSAALIKAFDDPTKAWRWTFWHLLIMNAAIVLAIVIFFKESRGSVLLSRKAKALNRWYELLESAGVYGVWFSAEEEAQIALKSTSETHTTTSQSFSKLPAPHPNYPQGRKRIRWVVKEDELRPGLLTMISTSVRRPFHMLFTEPIVFCFSLWAAFSWGVLYLSFSVVPFLYGNNLNLSSRVYTAMIVASVVATMVGISQESLLKHPQWRILGPDDPPYTDSRFWAFMRRRFPPDAPESRLYFACIIALLLPAGFFGAFLSPSYMDGYSHAVGLGFATWGIYSVYLAAFNYLADSYHIYASSALAAQSACRNVLGGIFPLITKAMFSRLGLRGAGGLLGGIAMGLSVIPWVLVLYGGDIRAKSKFATSLQK